MEDGERSPSPRVKEKDKEKEKEKEKKRRRRKRERKRESRVEQPKPMLTPGGGPSQVVTPRGEKRSKVWLGESPPGSPKGEVVTVFPSDFVKRMPLQGVPMYPLPPEPAAPGYIGQYVQSALTGDFKYASHAPTIITPADLKSSKKKGEPQNDLHFRNFMITVSLAFSHLRAALLLAFLLIYLTTNTTYDHFIWFYKLYSSPTQKVLNILSYLAFSASLCPLAVTLQETADPETHPAPRTGSIVFSSHVHLALIYGVIVSCCVFTGAFDDVVWEYRKQIDSDYRPLPAPVNGRLLASGFTSTVAPVQLPPCGAQTTMDRCESIGCCWCELCAQQCSYAADEPIQYTFNADRETSPFSYTRAVELCSLHNSQLCSFAELCENGRRVTSLVPINDHWNTFSIGCEAQPSPTFFTTTYLVYCCRRCPYKRLALETTTGLEGRAKTFKIITILRLSLAALGYVLGLYQVVGFHERHEDEEETPEPKENVLKGPAQAVSRRRETAQGMKTPDERDLEGLSPADKTLLETIIKDDGISKLESSEEEEEEKEQGVPTSYWMCGVMHVSLGWWKCFVVSLLLILPEVGVFVYFVARHSLIVWVPLAVVGFLTHLFMFLAVFTEPGIIPRYTGPKPRENETATIMWGSTYLLHLDKLCKVGDTGHEMVRRWCSTCKVLRPPRASHCSYCNNCVDMFDHHCGVIGACVGKRNFRYFAGFLWTASAMALWVFGWSLYYHFFKDSFMDHMVDPGVAMPDGANIASIALMVYAALVMWTVGWASLMYLRYTLINHTQREWEKRNYLYGASPSPFNTSCFPNCASLLCTSHPSMLVSPSQQPIKTDPWERPYPIVDSSV